EGAGTDGNVLAGNYIGTDATGTLRLANGTNAGTWPAAGVAIVDNASNNRVGTDGNGVGDAAERNIVSGNIGTGGLGGFGTATNDNTIAGNFIGTDISGTLDLGNGGGILVFFGAQRTRIGTNGDGSPTRRSAISSPATVAGCSSTPTTTWWPATTLARM